MPLPGYIGLTVTPEARKAAHKLVVEMTVRHRRRFTISEAIIQAAEDIAQEAMRRSELEAAAH
jgi:hypothetical protein